MTNGQVTQHQQDGCNSFHVVSVWESVVCSALLDVCLYLWGAADLHPIWSVWLLYSRSMGLTNVLNYSQSWLCRLFGEAGWQFFN